jgi:AraC-like DNA-binding protein
MSSLSFLIHGLGIGAALILMLQLAYRSCSGRSWLVLFLGLLTSGFILETLFSQRLDSFITDVLTSMVWPFLPVVLWCYVGALTQTKHPFLKRHFLLPTIATFCLLPLLSLDASVYSWIDNIEHAKASLDLPKGEETLLLLALLGLLVFCLLWIGLLCGYGLAMVHRLRRYDQYLRNHFSNLEGLDRHRIRLLLFITAGVVVLELSDQLFTLANHTLLPDELELTLRVLLLISFGLIGLSEQHSPAHQLDEQVLDTERTFENNEALDGNEVLDSKSRSAPAYSKSSLSEADCRRMLEKLDRHMQENLAWRNSELSLLELASATGIRPNYISQALNTVGEHNFFSYVNQWRIREACDLLCNSNNTVLAISTQVGFNAKSTFNTAFRRYTQQTPTQFRASKVRA